MKKILLSVIFIWLLNATEVVENYRLYGIQSTHQMLENLLQSPEYWNDVIKDIDVSYGYYTNKENIIVCNKSIPQFTLYNIKGKQLEKDSEIGAFVGQILGDKKIEGDLKTPIGAYDLVEKKEDVDQFYGPMAFVTSYPNLYDRLKHKSGYGIWIHGLPLNNEQRTDYTKGCIAINNEYLASLNTKIDYKKSILIIYEKESNKVEKSEIAILMSELYKWRYFWIKHDFEKYIEFYHQDFRRFDGKNLDKFKYYKKLVFQNRSKKSITFSNINISPYPTADNIKKFRITFYEDYKSPRVNFSGNKELYVSIQNSKMKILVEK